MTCDIATRGVPCKRRRGTRPAAVLAGVLLALTVAVLNLAGCSQPERLDTPETRNERLKLPPDLVSAQTDDSMRIPALAGESGSGDDGASRPVLPETIGVSVHRAGDTRWLTVDAEPRQVYRWAGSYLERLGVEVARRAPQLGILETAWVYYGAPLTHGVFAPVVKEADAAEVADRYVMRFERGDRAGTTDVFVANRRIQRGDSGQWRRAGAEPYLETEFLRGFMLYLGVAESDSLQRMRRSTDEGGGARMVRLDSGATALGVPGDMDTAWRRVGQALDRAGFTVVSRDSARRTFVVRYDPEASTRESDDESEVPRYRLSLDRRGDGVAVTVEPLDGQSDGGGDVGERILALLLEQLG